MHNFFCDAQLYFLWQSSVRTLLPILVFFFFCLSNVLFGKVLFVDLRHNN